MHPSGPLPVVRRVFRHPAIRRVLFSYFAFHVAEFGTWVAILLYAYERTGSASVGLVALVQLVPAALVAAPAASLGDRYPRERVLTVGYLVQAVAMFLTGAAMATAVPVPVVLFLAAAASSALVITRPTQSALLPALASTPDELTAANGAAGVVEGTGVLAGPLVAAAILTVSTTSTVFLVAGAALTIAGLATFGLRTPGAVVAPVGAGSAPDDVVDPSVLAGLRIVARDPDARLIVGLLTARMVVIGCADVVFVLMAIELLQTGEPGAGLLNAALGAGTIVGGAATFALIGRDGLASAAAVGALVWGATLASAALLGAPAVALLLIVVGGAGLAVVDVVGRTLLQRSIDDEVLARVFGLQEGLAMGGLAIGSTLVAVLTLVTDLLATILVVAAILPIVALATWRHLAALDRRATVPVRALSMLRRTSLFGPLPPPQLEAVARHGVYLTVPTGIEVIREGDPGDRYYLIVDGAVAVTKAGRHLRDEQEPGEGFGEIALLHDVPRTATVTTTRESVLFAIDRAPFLAAVTGHPGAYAAARAEVDQRDRMGSGVGP